MQPESSDMLRARLHSAFREGDPNSEQKKSEFENIRLIEAIMNDVVARDFDAVAAKLADDVDLEIFGPPDTPFVGRWQGRAEAVEAMKFNFAQVSEQEPHIESVTAQGDTVVVMGWERGVYLPNGRRYQIHWVQLFQFRGGLMCRFRELIDTASWLMASRPEAWAVMPT